MALRFQIFQASLGVSFSSRDYSQLVVERFSYMHQGRPTSIGTYGSGPEGHMHSHCMGMAIKVRGEPIFYADYRS